MQIVTRLSLKWCACKILFFIACLSVSAQVPVELNLKTPYYIAINQSHISQVYEIQDGLLNLQYMDQSGEGKEILLEIHNWKFEPIGRFTLDKTFGLNHYTIDLAKRIGDLDFDRTYFCSLKDESGNRYEWGIRLIAPVKSNLEIDIFVNPVQVSCTDYSNNLIGFYGDIRKGKAPYSIRWYVLNNTRTDFLFQPKEEQIADAGKTSTIEVDKAPAYYVLLDVTDACGTNTRKMLLVECTSNEKKVNTVFIEPLDYLKNQINPIKTN